MPVQPPDKRGRLQLRSPNAVGDPAMPVAFELQAAYPNPFNSSVRIALNVAQESQTTVRIFDIVGQEVSTLINSKLSAGESISLSECFWSRCWIVFPEM
ncbi:MAG: T9SS type A sorting domain-containing protein [bacterium]|nr:T9SS type A sorting domain-containing protein [bacterium]